MFGVIHYYLFIPQLRRSRMEIFMNVEFNLLEISKLFISFYDLCGLHNTRLALVNSEDQSLFEYPAGNCRYCSLIQNSSEGKHLCRLSDQYGFSMADQSPDNYVLYSCHAGLTHACFAIKYEKQVVGYFFIGSFLQVEENQNINFEETLQKCSHLISENNHAFWKTALQELDILSTSRINSIIHIMHICINNILYQNMVKIKNDPIWDQIYTFVNANLNNNFSLSDMSKELFISISTISHKTKNITGVSIGSYILRHRMDLACSYLLKTDYPISQISEMIGLTNYNYFSRLFKKVYGVSPSQFRKIYDDIDANKKV